MLPDFSSPFHHNPTRSFRSRLPGVRSERNTAARKWEPSVPGRLQPRWRYHSIASRPANATENNASTHHCDSNASRSGQRDGEQRQPPATQTPPVRTTCRGTTPARTTSDSNASRPANAMGIGSTRRQQLKRLSSGQRALPPNSVQPPATQTHLVRPTRWRTTPACSAKRINSETTLPTTPHHPSGYQIPA